LEDYLEEVLMEENPLIYTVGDSHCWHAWCKIPFVKFLYRGPMTMYSFGLKVPIVVDEIPEDRPIIFCWGEIDCRCHVHKYQPWQETVDRLVADYLVGVTKNAERHKNIWLFNVVPPPRRKDVPVENPDFPFLGTDAERLSYVRRMTQRLKEGPYPFVDIYDQYADPDGFLRMELSDGVVHIADEKPLIKYLEEKLNALSNL
jgi:hypothetical protein